VVGPDSVERLTNFAALPIVLSGCSLIPEFVSLPFVQSKYSTSAIAAWEKIEAIRTTKKNR
jgi:hypothetical protein